MKYEGIYDYQVEYWHKYLETNDSSKLIDIDNAEEFAKLVKSQLIDEFGVSIDFEMLFYKMEDLNRWEIAKLNGDASADTFIISLNNDIEYIEEKYKKMNLISNIKKRHANLRREIETTFPGRNLKGMTIFDFYNDINDISEMSQERENRELLKKLG